MHLEQILLRQEAPDKYWLYNPLNTALLELNEESKNDFLKLKNNIESGNSFVNKDSEYLIEILKNNNFLTNKNLSSTSSSKKQIFYEDNEANFWSLKSHKAPIHLIWCLTPVCNLRCAYCFPDVESKYISSPALDTNKIFNLLKQIVDSKVLSLTLSGGEALLRKDLWEIVKELKKESIKVNLLSNGILIKDDDIEKIKHYSLSMGISLDGHNDELNGITRGKGFFNKILSNIRKFKKEDITFNTITTVNKYNFEYLEEIVDFLFEEGLKSIVLQDLRWFKSNELYDSYRLTNKQFLQAEEKINLIKDKYKGKIHINSTELIFLNTKDKTKKTLMNNCPAGDHSAYIDHEGNLYPCTNIPTPLGNLFDIELKKLWQTSQEIIHLRELKKKTTSIIEGCEACDKKSYCGGGCRGEALSYYNNILKKVPRCCH